VTPLCPQVKQTRGMLLPVHEQDVFTVQSWCSRRGLHDGAKDAPTGGSKEPLTNDRRSAQIGASNPCTPLDPGSSVASLCAFPSSSHAVGMVDFPPMRSVLAAPLREVEREAAPAEARRPAAQPRGAARAAEARAAELRAAELRAAARARGAPQRAGAPRPGAQRRGEVGAVESPETARIRAPGATSSMALKR